MPTLIVQQGHCYRKTGATGTAGEQGYATLVAAACFQLFNQRDGWTVIPTLADADQYRADAFIAVHCDGATSAAARGASAGYQTAEGQALAHAWQRAYAAHGWPLFRPDNYTPALRQYYGVTKAVAAGTRRACIIECGFLTSPADKALLVGPGGVHRVALAIGDALGIAKQSTPKPPNRAPGDLDMYLIRGDSTELDENGQPYGDRVYAVESRIEPGVGVVSQRYAITSAGDPTYLALLAASGGTVARIPQDALDKIPKAEGSR